MIQPMLIARLRDGRAFSYVEVGRPEGQPVFFFHGGLQSCLVSHPDPGIVADAGVRLISVDRPRFGRSDLVAERGLMDWPTDVEELAEALSLDRFAVLGWSAGGPYALACARALAERVTTTVVVSGAGRLGRSGAVGEISAPAIRLGGRLARRSFPLTRLAIRSCPAGAAGSRGTC